MSKQNAMDFNSKTFLHKLSYHSSANTLRNVCRICLNVLSSKNKCTPSLLEMSEQQPCYWYEMITSINVSNDDNLPKNFCAGCVEELENSYKFRNKCIAADLMLKNHVKQISVKEEKNMNQQESQNNINVEDKIKVELDENEMFEIEYLEEFNNDPNEMGNEEIPKSDYLPDQLYEITNSTLRNKTGKRRSQYREKKQIKRTCIRKKDRNVGVLKIDVSNKPNLCLVCKKFFDTDNDLKIHMSLHVTNPQWICNACGKECKDKPTLRRHILRHMSVKRHSCEICNKSFCELSELKKHLRIHTGEVVEKKKCYTCKTTFESHLALSAHQPCKAAVASFSCAECPRTFVSARLLASHSRIHDEAKPYHCKYCDKRFKHESTLSTHHRTHTGEKPYVCSYCGKAFIQSTNLTLHMRTHTGEKPYSCQHCSMKFSSGSSLKTHLFTHSGEKPHTCDVCGKKLARGSLAAHRRIHSARVTRQGARVNGVTEVNDEVTDVKGRHSCSVCGKTFVTAAVLRDHILLHTGEKPFECKLCLLKYPTKTRLDRHNRLKHGKRVKPKTYQRLGKLCSENNSDNTKNTKKDTEDQISGIEIKLESPVEACKDSNLQADGETNTQLIVEDETFQKTTICLPEDSPFSNGNVSLITVKEDDISETRIEGGTVKLLQVDQSLLQIHTTAGQMTISKITSKMTTNYQ